ncbi:phosphatidylcholine transfer protein-like isoform X2 [Sinocyclocheilus rhinocerous]|uniref:phosphatidylcholine transfer protein-like isoform X2 n=1 Tax=Sinocyclocheilus rhinocerous TaxID=307959 RepID=UPI0007B8C5FC|nr:PREDICTED: phosphatidylcholine transfer protein-like isoform X2 [Sinocyclocheilus rhinocerous]
MGALHRDHERQNIPTLQQGNGSVRVQSVRFSDRLRCRSLCRCLHGSELQETVGLVCQSSSCCWWSNSIRYAELHEKDYGGQKAIYWEVKYPLPLSNRDYVYVRERRDLDVGGRKICVVLAKSSAVSQCPEKKGVIRVKDYKQSLAMESDGAGGTKVFMNYFDNPGGMIPAWLVNWTAKTGVPAFLTDMKKACSNYSSYCNNSK